MALSPVSKGWHPTGAIEILHARKVPAEGLNFKINGVVRERVSSSLSGGSSEPTRPAMAMRCTMAFVELPMACRVRMAFSKASMVRILEGDASPFDQLDRSAARDVGLVGARVHRWDGGVARQSHTRASPAAIVEAVPITMQCPDCARCNSATGPVFLGDALSP